MTAHPHAAAPAAPYVLSEHERRTLRIGGGGDADWLDTCACIVSVPGERLTGRGQAALFERCAHVARARLSEGGLTPSSVVPPRVVDQLEDGLHRWLGFISGPALAVYPIAGNTSRDLAGWLVDRPVLARLIASIVKRWSAVVLELATRLEHDRAAIGQAFFPGQMPGDLIDVAANLSDPHDGGRTVMRLTFTGGAVLFYKPRAAGMEIAFEKLLDWCHARGGMNAVRVPRHLSRDGYAWAEHVPHRVCASWPELVAFSHSAGSLMALASVLETTDLHDGNVVASGPHLVPVDLETLFSPRRAHEREPLARTAMLPAWRVRPGEPAADIGTLGSLFASVSTPSYERSPESRPIMDLQSLSTLAARAGEPGDAVTLCRRLCSEVIEGFSSGYRFLAAHRDALLSGESPLAGFEQQDVRWVFRDTSVYLDTLRAAIRAHRWREWDGWLAECSRLEASLPPGDVARFAPLVRAEATSLATGDVPYFHASTDSEDLSLGKGEVVRGLFENRSHATVRRRIAALDQRDLLRQIEIIEHAFAARLAGPPSSNGIL